MPIGPLSVCICSSDEPIVAPINWNLNDQDVKGKRYDEEWQNIDKYILFSTKKKNTKSLVAQVTSLGVSNGDVQGLNPSSPNYWIIKNKYI